jgi:hypothetical protein
VDSCHLFGGPTAVVRGCDIVRTVVIAVTTVVVVVVVAGIAGVAGVACACAVVGIGVGASSARIGRGSRSFPLSRMPSSSL